MDLRDKRIAILTRWHRDLAENFTRALPRVLDDLEAADAECGLSERPMPGQRHAGAVTVTIDTADSDELIGARRAKTAPRSSRNNNRKETK